MKFFPNKEKNMGYYYIRNVPYKIKSTPHAIDKVVLCPLDHCAQHIEIFTDNFFFFFFISNNNK